MKPDISGEQDVQLLVRTFYDKVLQDPMLGPLFKYVLDNHWQEHLQLMDRFWMNILFYSGKFDGNPLKTHKEIHHFSRLNAAHFMQWLQLFNSTIEELFEGEKAEQAKERAFAISEVMKVKIIDPEKR